MKETKKEVWCSSMRWQMVTAHFTFSEELEKEFMVLVIEVLGKGWLGFPKQRRKWKCILGNLLESENRKRRIR